MTPGKKSLSNEVLFSKTTLLVLKSESPSRIAAVTVLEPRSLESPPVHLLKTTKESLCLMTSIHSILKQFSSSGGEVETFLVLLLDFCGLNWMSRLSKSPVLL